MYPGTNFPKAMFMNPTCCKWKKANTATIYISGNMDSREWMLCQIIFLRLGFSLHSDTIMINVTTFLQKLDYVGDLNVHPQMEGIIT